MVLVEGPRQLELSRHVLHILSAAKHFLNFGGFFVLGGLESLLQLLSHFGEGFFHFLYLLILLGCQEHHVIELPLNLSEPAIAALSLEPLLQLDHFQMQLGVFTHDPLILLLQWLSTAPYLGFELLINFFELIESLRGLEHVVQQLLGQCRALNS